MKILRNLSIIMTILFVLGGCDTTERYELSFETHGGSTVESMLVEGGSTIELPEPEREYHTFEGWYLDEDYKEPAEFDTVPEESMTLHARWDFNESEYVSALNEVEGLLGFEVVLSKRHEETLDEVSEQSHFTDILSAQRPYENHDAFLSDMEDALEVSTAMETAMDHYDNAESFDMDALFLSVAQSIEDTTLESVFDEAASSIVQTLNMYGDKFTDFNQQDMFEYFKNSNGESYAGLMSVSENYLATNRAVEDKDDLLRRLSSMEDGISLHLASGIYSLDDSININYEGTALIAATDEATVLDGGGLEMIVSIEADASQTLLQGLTFRNFTNQAVSSQASNTRIVDGYVNAPSLLESSVLVLNGDNPEVRHTQFASPISATDDVAFITLSTSGASIVNNRFMGGEVVSRGIHVNGSGVSLQDIAIEENELLGFKGEALVFETGPDFDLTNIEVLSNDFTNAFLGVAFRGENGAFDGVLLESNAFTSMNTYIDYDNDADVAWDTLLATNTFDFEAYELSQAAYPILSIEDALDLPEDSMAVIEGIVTDNETNAFYLEDETAAIYIDSVQAPSKGDSLLVAGRILKDIFTTSIYGLEVQETLSEGEAMPKTVYMDSEALENDNFLRRFVYHRLRLDDVEILSENTDGFSLALDTGETIDLILDEGVDASAYGVGDSVSIEGARLVYRSAGYTLLLSDIDHVSLYEAPDYSIETNVDVNETDFVLSDMMVPLDIAISANMDNPATMNGRLEMVVTGPTGASATLSDQVFPLTMVDAMHYEDMDPFSLPEATSVEREIMMTFTRPGLYTIELKLYDETDALIGETVEALEVETPYITVDFENLADEYLLDDGEVPLYLQTKDGVPYVDIETFLNLLDGGSLDGAIDLDPLNIIKTDSGLEIVYEWEDEETGESGSEAIYFDFDDNTVTVDSFDVFTAAQQSTQTDFGADLNLADYILQEGDPVVFDFDDYNFELLTYEDDYLMPFHIANLFFSGSMYDVYFNGDELYGIDTYQVLDGDVTSPLQDSSLSTETMPETYKQATYDYLAFSFDYFYGLKEDQGVSTYYNVFPDSIAEDGGRNHYKAIFNSVYDLDDLHSWYSMTGFFAPSYNPSASISDLGPRSQAFYEADDLLRQNHVCAQQGPSYYDNGRVARVPIHGFDEDTPGEFQSMLESVSEQGTVEEVIVDLSCNTGGIVGSMIQTLGYMTDEQIPLYNINPTDGSKVTYFYEADIEAYDFEWHIFSSPKTFSAGNMMVQVAKDMGLATIIGQDSAGGAASIKANITPSGAILFMSSTSVSADADFNSTEMGIPVDVEIPIDLYFDETTILEAIE